jgi:hypothetical protein
LLEKYIKIFKNCIIEIQIHCDDNESILFKRNLGLTLNTFLSSDYLLDVIMNKKVPFLEITCWQMIVKEDAKYHNLSRIIEKLISPIILVDIKSERKGFDIYTLIKALVDQILIAK